MNSNLKQFIFYSIVEIKKSFWRNAIFGEKLINLKLMLGEEEYICSCL